jgi:hypothetical protein
VALSFFSCDENNGIRKADTTSLTSSNNTANFLLINAVPDGPSLDFYVNGLQLTTVDIAKGQNGYSNVPITTPGLNNIANTSVRAKATASGTIGGLLGSNDAVFRATNTGIGNLVAAPNALYTFVAVDSINRPIPLRTFSLNSVTKALAADLTYYNRANGQQISLDQFKALPSDADRNKTVSLGTIPAGVSDPGGVRFLVLTDSYLAFSGSNTTQSQIRFINAVPNAYSLPVSTRISARLKPTAGATISLGTNSEYVMGVAGGFTPSAGSRATTVAFSLQTTATDPATLFSYTLELSTDGFTTIAFSLSGQTFEVGKIYTIVARGIVGKTGTKGLSAIVVKHN